MMSSTKPAARSSGMQEMDVEEMRNALYERLHNKGLLDSLKSQLRNYMVAELSGGANSRKSKSTNKPSLQKRVIDSLIYKYLCDSGCDYSVGVFLPEAEMTKREILSGDEICRLLHLNPKRLTSASGEGNSLLHLAINRVMATTNDQLSEVSTQTDIDTTTHLIDKLTSIDLEFSTRTKNSDTSTSVEEKLLAYQKKAEQLANEKAQQEIERWKRLEVELIQITERDKLNKKFNDKKQRLDEEYRRKVAAVTERERSLAESVKLEFESVQRETYQQRQQLLQQSEQMRQRENEIREQKDHYNRLNRLNEEKLEKLEQMLKKREQEVHQKELHLDNTLRVQQQRCRLEEKMAYDTKYRELKAFEEQLKDKQQGLEREKRSLLTDNERSELIELRQSSRDLDSEVRRSKVEIASLEMKISGLQERLAKVFDYEVLKESNISLKKDLELTKDRLDGMLKEHSLLQEKYEQLIIDGREKAGVAEIMLIKTQMQRERDKAMDDKVITEHRLKDMESKYNDQLRKNQALIREFEIQTDRQKHMNKEYSSLRKQLSPQHGVRTTSAKGSPAKDASFYDTSFRKTLPPELALNPDWTIDSSSGAEISTTTEESIVTETRKRLDYLSREADNLQSAFQSLTRSSPPKPVTQSPPKPVVQSPPKPVAVFGVESHRVSFKPTVTSPYKAGNLSPDHILDVDQSQYSSYTTGSTQPAVNMFPLGGLDLESASQTKAGNDAPVAREAADIGRITPTLSSVHHQPSPTFQDPSVEVQSQAEQFNRPTPNKEITSQPVVIESSTVPSGNVKETTSSPAGQPAVSLDSKWKAQPMQSQTAAKPMSLADKWKDEVVEDSKNTDGISTDQVLSLDSQWKTQSVTPKALPTKPHGTAADSSGKPKQLSGDPDMKEAKKDDMSGIDPVMQKYMQMLKQQQQSPETTTTTKATAALTVVSDVLGGADDLSISDHVSPAKSDGAATDEDFW